MLTKHESLKQITANNLKIQNVSGAAQNVSKGRVFETLAVNTNVFLLLKSCLYFTESDITFESNSIFKYNV